MWFFILNVTVIFIFRNCVTVFSNFKMCTRLICMEICFCNFSLSAVFIHTKTAWFIIRTMALRKHFKPERSTMHRHGVSSDLKNSKNFQFSQTTRTVPTPKIYISREIPAKSFSFPPRRTSLFSCKYNNLLLEAWKNGENGASIFCKLQKCSFFDFLPQNITENTKCYILIDL